MLKRIKIIRQMLQFLMEEHYCPVKSRIGTIVYKSHHFRFAAGLL